MSKAQQLLDEINTEAGFGVFLMAQMDSVPDTLQCIIASTVYDEAVDGLRDKSRYIVRAVGVQEHRLSVGMFRTMTITDDHPLLYEVNQKPVGVFFRGQPDDVNSLMVDLFQAYASTFGPWRHIPAYLNTAQPLVDLLMSGGALLGEMPGTLAQRMDNVLQKHSLETKLIEGERPPGTPKVKLLLLDESYIVAMDFSVDELGKA